MTDKGTFAVSNLEYDIITTLSNLLQGSETLGKYQADAERVGDAATAAIFQRLHDSYYGYATELNAALRRVAGQS